MTQFVLAFVCLHFAQSDTEVLNSLEEICITRVAAINSSLECSTLGTAILPSLIEQSITDQRID